MISYLQFWRIKYVKCLHFHQDKRMVVEFSSQEAMALSKAYH